MKYFHDIYDPAEATQLYRELSMKLHPDRGGSVDDFRAMQTEYRDWDALYRNGRLSPTVPPIPPPVPQSVQFVPQYPPIAPPERNPVAQAIVDELQAGIVRGIRFAADALFAPDPPKKRKRRKR